MDSEVGTNFGKKRPQTRRAPVDCLFGIGSNLSRSIGKYKILSNWNLQLILPIAYCYFTWTLYSHVLQLWTRVAWLGKTTEKTYRNMSRRRRWSLKLLKPWYKSQGGHSTISGKKCLSVTMCLLTEFNLKLFLELKYHQWNFLVLLSWNWKRRYKRLQTRIRSTIRAFRSVHITFGQIATGWDVDPDSGQRWVWLGLAFSRDYLLTGVLGYRPYFHTK